MEHAASAIKLHKIICADCALKYDTSFAYYACFNVKYGMDVYRAFSEV
jgi:hypothetical protein